MTDKRKKAVKVNLNEFLGDNRNALPTAPADRSNDTSYNNKMKSQDWTRDSLQENQRGGRRGGYSNRDDDRDNNDRSSFRRGGFRNRDGDDEEGSEQPRSRAEEASGWRRDGPDTGDVRQPPRNEPRADNASDWRRNEDKADQPSGDGQWRSYPRSDAFTDRNRHDDRRDDRRDNRRFGDNNYNRDSRDSRDSRDARDSRESSRYGGYKRDDGYAGNRGDSRTRDSGDTRPASLRNLGQALKKKRDDTTETTTTKHETPSTASTTATTATSGHAAASTASTVEQPKKEEPKPIAKKDKPLILNNKVAAAKTASAPVPEKEVPVQELTDAISKCIESKASPEDFITAINGVVESTVTPIPTAAKQVGDYVFPLVFSPKTFDEKVLNSHMQLLNRVCNDKPSGIKLIYSAQVAWSKHGHPKGQIKEVMTKLLDEKVVTVAYILGWRDDLTDKSLPGKPKMLLQINAWLKGLEEKAKEEEKKRQQNVEEEEEDDEDIDEALDEEYASNRDL